jgi:hypothetical protein
VAVAEEPQQLVQLHDDQSVGQGRYRTAHLRDGRVEPLLAHVPERGIGPALHLARQELQIGTPTHHARHAARVDEGEQVSEPLVTMKNGQVGVGPGMVQVSVSQRERSLQPIEGRLLLLEQRMAIGDSVGRLGGIPVA